MKPSFFHTATSTSIDGLDYDDTKNPFLQSSYYNHVNQTEDEVMKHNMIAVTGEILNLSGGYFISSISACLFAVVYLSFFSPSVSESSSNNVSLSNAVLSSPYYFHHSHQNLEEELGISDPNEFSKWSTFMLLSEMIYWSFLVSYSYTAMASNTLHPGTISFFYLRLLIHLFCVYVICSQNHRSNTRVDIAGSIAFIALIGETFLVISLSGTQSNLVMAYFHRFLDFLLVMGHRWDMNPSWEVILNCRLFFIAIGGGLLHVDIVLSTS